MAYRNQAKLILNARKRLQLSQKDVADQLGLVAQVMSNTERGTAPFPTERLKRLSEVLDIDTKDLIQALKNDYLETLKEKSGL